MDKTKSLYALKWNPFSPEVPTDALLASPPVLEFCWRIVNVMLREGGFAMLSGDPGLGKSAVLRIAAAQLADVPDATVGVITHPQSNLGDFYREMGDVFGVPLRPSNRWGGCRALRERWQAHIDSTLMRPVLIIDEAQEMQPAVLNELRLLASTRFDSRVILSVLLAGDARLLHKLQREELLPLASRIRVRLHLGPASGEELARCLLHRMKAAGNPQLMTTQLVATLCDHALGNYRTLLHMASELLAAAAQREAPRIDEKLYLEVFSSPDHRKPTRHAPARARR
jgi:general secretion pathway protein A